MLNLRTPLFLCLLAGVILSLASCYRQRAELTLRNVTEKITELDQNYDATFHEPQQFTAIQERVEQANNLLQSDPQQALDLANQADTEATQLIDSVKDDQATRMFSMANEEIKIADINDLRRIDPERNTRIRELKEQADAARADNDWDEVINVSRQIVNEVDNGLATLRNDAEQEREEAQDKQTELDQNGGRQYVPEIVIAVEDEISKAIQISEEDRDYQLAINKFREAISLAQRGIDQALREKSRQDLEEVEESLTTALIEGAQDFKPDEYERTFNLYEEMLAEYNEGRYSRVLEGVVQLRADARRLVIDTKREASRDRIQTIENNIRNLENDGILDYLPGILADLSGFLQNAQNLFRPESTEEDFDEIKNISIQAREELERVKQRYESVAVDRIRQAKNVLEEARALFDEMEGFFEEPVSENATSAERAFFNQKQARQTEIGATLSEESTNLNLADLQRQQEQNRNAITLAEEVEASAEELIGEIFRLVAENANIELSKLISRYERDGAREFAPQELQRSRSALSEVQQLIQADQNRQATQRASNARAEIELMAQVIAGRATEDLREARAALAEAETEKTLQFRSEMLGQVRQLIGDAEEDLQQERLKLALEKARRATELSRQAQTESNLLSSKEEIDAAQIQLEQAQEAGAELYAGREIEEARRLLSSSRSLFAAEDYVKAEELAVSSAQRSRDALYNRIDQAETSISTARAIGGWDFNSRALGEASSKVREARELLEQGQYQQSESLAITAKNEADVLIDRVKDFNFNTSIQRIKNNLNEGTRQGINFFQPEESIAVRKQLSSLQNRYNRDDYERIMAEVEELEAELRTTLTETDTLVTTVAQQQQRRLDDLLDEGANLFATDQAAMARDNLKFALLDYKRGLYKSAHSNLDNAIDMIDEVERRLRFIQYTEQVNDLFATYRNVQDQFSAVLALDPSELKELAVGPNGAAQSVAISAQITPAQFRERIDELYSRSLIIEVPSELQKVHESVIQAFTEGRTAAFNFEKLAILNRLATSEAEQLIDSAYTRMNRSNRIVTEVQRQIITDETRFRSVQAFAGNIAQ